MKALRYRKFLFYSLAAMMGVFPGCGADGFLGLQDYQRDLLTGGLLAAALLNRLNADPPAGTPQDGRDGEDGLPCWDLNGNGESDAQEDVNGDGAFDARDCAGSDAPGGDLIPGQDGADGINCWDLNGNGVGDDNEDLNDDGAFDARDCQGPAGHDGLDGNDGGRGPAGEPGEDGQQLFHVFIDDFFALGAAEGEFPVNLVSINEPALGNVFNAASASAVAFRTAIPQIYHPGNDVNMRLFFFRTGIPDPGDCFILRLDARRLRPGSGVEEYDFDDCVECGTRYVRIDVDALPPGAAAGGNGTDVRMLVTLDLPINTPEGLGFPNDLAPAQFLAFELSVHRFDGTAYQILGVEFTEHRPGNADLRGATVFFDGKSSTCDFEDCNENGIPDPREIVTPGGVVGRGGSVFLTGHDPDFHASLGGNLAGARKINTAAIDFIMNPTFNPFVNHGAGKFLYVQSRIGVPGGHTDGKVGVVASGYTEGVHFDHHDAGTLVAGLNALGVTYGGIVLASDFGGLLTSAELDILNANSDLMIRFLNNGGGLYAMAESNNGAHLTPNGGQFGFLPFVVSSTSFDQSEVGVTVTPFGGSLGLTAGDVNGNASHNVFTASSGLNVVDLDQFGNILSLAGRGLINPDGGRVTDCNENGRLDECEIQAAEAEDCNENGVPDECEVADPSLDCNDNDVPDECEIQGDDCNLNGTLDWCDINADDSLDENENGVPDECEVACVCHEDIEVVCEIIDTNAASEGVPVFYELPTVDGDCFFLDTCDEPTANAAGLDCSVICTPFPGATYGIGDTIVTCSSLDIPSAAGDPPGIVVDTCEFTVTVLPIPPQCMGTFSGTVTVGKETVPIRGQLDANGTITASVQLKIGELSFSGIVSSCGHLDMSNAGGIVRLTGSVFFSPNGCFGNGTVLTEGNPNGTWAIDFDAE